MYFSRRLAAAEGIASVIPGSTTVLRQLPLRSLHLAQGARFEPFGGWEMPLHYPAGLLAEHRHTRAAAALFDVSHMGQILVSARPGPLETAARALEALMPVDLLGLATGRQRYAFFTNAAGGVLDDLMISNLGDCLHLVVNAARTAADLAHLRQGLPADCAVELLTDRTLLAIQGPAAAELLESCVPGISAMRFLDARRVSLDAASDRAGRTSCVITRSGYTGEDGFEISATIADGHRLAGRLLSHPTLRWAGLGARDSLRLEAGLCLYGHELTADTTPVEANLAWAIGAARRTGGARAGGFPGASAVLAELTGGTARIRVGMRADKRPVRAGCALFADAAGQIPVGRVTSGSFGPSLAAPVAMGYVPRDTAAAGGVLWADVRGQRIPVTLCPLPFVPHRYHR